jgi:hypothetical protein
MKRMNQWHQVFVRFAIVAAALALGASPSPVRAQAGAAVQPTNEVKVKGRGVKGIYRVVFIDSVELTLTRPPGDSTRTVRYDELRSLKVSRGMRTGGEGAFSGFMIGAVVGGGLGALMGYSGGDDDPGFLSMTAAEKAQATGVVLGLVGGVGGMVFGAMSPGRKWEAVPLIPLQVRAARAGGVTLGLSLRF